MSDITKKDLNEAFGVDEAPKTGKKWIDVNPGQGTTWDFKNEPVISGVYKGSHTAETKYGEKTLFEVETSNGEAKDIWETAQIKRFFEGLELGKEVRIEFTGKGETKNGQMVNQFQFQVAQ